MYIKYFLRCITNQFFQKHKFIFFVHRITVNVPYNFETSASHNDYSQQSVRINFDVFPAIRLYYYVL